ncbi:MULTISPECIES: hypothetical protein [Actinomycetes]|uniref:CHRD domain-containing protein n=2 Tax=Actinomycetes TaxID=1760 RepID=A0ABP6LUS7_9MICC|nr:hypothetical protein [Nesterenkonia sp. PF2B19]OSM43581.1 hypothetical protein BCY76_007610 [Nesterenkonia sp. PF2B19]
MRTSTFFAVPALALGGLALTASPAMADSHDDSWSVQTSLEELNSSGTTGEVMIDIHGQEATVTMNVTGAAEEFMDGPFPHAQHIHIGAQGLCPGPDADTDGDGVVSTPEGHHFYGDIGTSLTTEGDTSPDSGLAIDRFPGGSEYSYERTFELSDDTLTAVEEGTAVVVVHGVDPDLMPEEAAQKQSELDPELPLAATLPAACGTLSASQMEEMPDGGADTGAPVQADNGMNLALGGGALALAALGGAWAVRRHTARA